MIDQPTSSSDSFLADAGERPLGAALPSIESERFPGDFIGPLYHEADMLRTPLQLGPAAAAVPEGPGLGVELDLDQLEAYRDRSTKAQGTGGVTDVTFEG